MAKRDLLLQCVTAGILVVACLIFFRYYCPESLFLKEQVSEFSFTTDCFISYVHKPAWLACYVGNLLAYLFIPFGGGPVLVTLILLLEWWLLAIILKRFAIDEMANLYALFPIVLESGGYCNEKYLLPSVISFILSLGFFLIYTYISDKKWSVFWGLMFLPIIYFLAGSRLTIYLVMILLYEANKNEQRWLFWFFLLLIGGTFPSIMQTVYGINQDVAYLYPHKGVPAFFPAMLFCSSLLFLQTKVFREMKVCISSVFITSLILLTVLSTSIFLYADF